MGNMEVGVAGVEADFGKGKARGQRNQKGTEHSQKNRFPQKKIREKTGYFSKGIRGSKKSGQGYFGKRPREHRGIWGNWGITREKKLVVGWNQTLLGDKVGGGKRRNKKSVKTRCTGWKKYCRKKKSYHKVVHGEKIGLKLPSWGPVRIQKGLTGGRRVWRTRVIQAAGEDKKSETFWGWSAPSFSEEGWYPTKRTLGKQSREKKQGEWRRHAATKKNPQKTLNGPQGATELSFVTGRDTGTLQLGRWGVQSKTMEETSFEKLRQQKLRVGSHSGGGKCETTPTKAAREGFLLRNVLG